MQSKLWKFYIDALQGHPTPCTSAEGTSVEVIENQVKGAFKDKSAPVLVIGCGDGKEVEIFRELGYKEVHGITYDPRVPYRVTDVWCADMHDLTFLPVNHYKYVYCNQTFEHAFAPFIFCLEVWSVMQDFGMWWFSYPARKETGRSGLTDPMTAEVSHHHPTMLMPEEAEHLLNVTGFTMKFYSPEGNEIFIGQKEPFSRLQTVLNVHPDVINTLNRRINIKRTDENIQRST